MILPIWLKLIFCCRLPLFLFFFYYRKIYRQYQFHSKFEFTAFCDEIDRNNKAKRNRVENGMNNNTNTRSLNYTKTRIRISILSKLIRNGVSFVAPWILCFIRMLFLHFSSPVVMHHHQFNSVRFHFSSAQPNSSTRLISLNIRSVYNIIYTISY